VEQKSSYQLIADEGNSEQLREHSFGEQSGSPKPLASVTGRPQALIKKRNRQAGERVEDLPQWGCGFWLAPWPELRSILE